MKTRSISKMLGPFATTRRLTPIHQMSLVVLSRAACASMSTTTTTTTTTTRDRGDRYGPMEWAQSGTNACWSYGWKVGDRFFRDTVTSLLHQLNWLTAHVGQFVTAVSAVVVPVTGPHFRYARSTRLVSTRELTDTTLACTTYSRPVFSCFRKVKV